MKARKLLWVAAGVFWSLSAGAATEHDDIQAASAPVEHHDTSGPYRKGQELVRHARNVARLAGTSAAAAQSADVGDVAVIVDNGQILIPPRPANPFDLPEPSSLSFVPSGAGAFAVSAGNLAFDSTTGGALSLGDDDALEVSLGGFNFPYLGNSYGSVFVGSDGHITLGAAEASSNTRNAGRHIGGPPRISPLFADLDPSATGAGSVNADVRADRIVVTWSGVPEFGTTNSNTFQAVLHSSGRIDFVYSTLALQFAVVGIAEGNDEGPINVVDLSAALPATFQAGAIFEEFSPAIVVQQMDVIALARAFYETHPDKFDFLVMFTADVVDLQGAFAFHLGLHNDTEGLGFFRTGGASTIFDSCSAVGLPAGCELESLLNMNRIGLYWPDEQKLVDPPIKKFRFNCVKPSGQAAPCGATFGGPPGSDQVSLRARWAGTLNGDFGAHGSYTLGLNSAMSIMGQEAGHRWLAFPAIRNPAAFGGALSGALLGRAQAHWSFFFNVTVPPSQFEALDGDPRSSSAEGNAIRDLGLGDPRCAAGKRLFQTQPNELIDGYTELDQYFAGVRTPAEVSTPFWYIRTPQVIFGGSPTAVSDARDDVLICGDRVDLTMNNIFAAGAVLGPSNGPRNPIIGDEQDAGPGITAADNATCTAQARCVDVKTMAFIVVVPNSPAAQTAVINQVDTFRRTWESYSNGPALGNRGARGLAGQPNYLKKFDTSLNPPNH
jgi:hypothetical protein